MFEFHIDDVPEETTVTQFIEDNSDIRIEIQKFKNYNNQKVYTKPLPIDVLPLWKSINEAFEVYGWWGFLLGNFVTGEKRRTPYYGGLSLTYNPSHWQELPVNAQTLGNMRFNLGHFFEGEVGKRVWDSLVFRDKKEKCKSEFYARSEKGGILSGLKYLFENGFISDVEYQIEKEKHKESKVDKKALKQRNKNTYSDSYGYCYRTPSSRHGLLGEFLDSSKRLYVRSRIATLKAPYYVHWHNDENIFFNTRVNIPVNASLQCFIHIASEENIFANDPGLMFCWDTEVPHKVSLAKGEGERTAIVAGFSPWFDFDAKTGVWRSNEFYGVAHPFEMFEEGCFL